MFRIIVALPVDVPAVPAPEETVRLLDEVLADDGDSSSDATM